MDVYFTASDSLVTDPAEREWRETLVRLQERKDLSEQRRNIRLAQHYISDAAPLSRSERALKCASHCILSLLNQ